MLVTKINTHVQDGLNRLLQQYKGRPLLKGFYTAPLQQFQDLEDAIYPLDAGRQLWDGTGTPAIGAQLDLIGQIVGITRNGLSDQEYILFIFGKIAANNSDDTIAAILTVVQYLFQAQQILFQEVFPAGLAIQALGAALPQNLWPVAKSLVLGAIGAGIQLDYIAASSYPSPGLDVFRFYAPGETSMNGFGDLNNPNIGGVFVGLI